MCFDHSVAAMLWLVPAHSCGGTAGVRASASHEVAGGFPHKEIAQSTKERQIEKRVERRRRESSGIAPSILSQLVPSFTCTSWLTGWGIAYFSSAVQYCDMHFRLFEIYMNCHGYFTILGVAVPHLEVGFYLYYKITKRPDFPWVLLTIILIGPSLQSMWEPSWLTTNCNVITADLDQVTRLEAEFAEEMTSPHKKKPSLCVASAICT